MHFRVLIIVCLCLASVSGAIVGYVLSHKIVKRSCISAVKTVEKKLPNMFYEIAREQGIKDKLVRFLKKYDAFTDIAPITLIRLGKINDGGYVVPEYALQKTDVLLGYGIADDSSFEEAFSSKYNKPSYGFDCGVDKITTSNPMFTFINECIATDSTLYPGQNSTKKISSFAEQLNRLNLHDKKIFIKMDIEGAEYDAMKPILKNSDNITGIAIEIHFMDPRYLEPAVQLLSDLSKNFILLHVRGNNYLESIAFTSPEAIGKIPPVIELTYINKNLIKKYNLSSNQKYPTSMDTPCNPATKESEFEILCN